MNRREFVSSLVAASGAFAYGAKPQVKRVLVMFKCHFDAGFINTQAAVVSKYFDEYFPRAIEIANVQRQSGDERYVWTTGSWLLYEYLEQANSEERNRMEQAIAAGDIAWHALPFNWQTELLDRSMIIGTLGFSQSLDHRFGRKTTGAKMTDVPGHSRGLVEPIVANGVTLLDIGVNAASTPPEVPDAFVWKEPNGASIIMLYHHAYGGVVILPQSDLAIAIEVRDDNSGPHTPQEIQKIYADLRRRFPNAKVEAANLTEIANAAEPFKKNLPVVTEEIGDTWIYGVASDPVKLARYRELLRARNEWLNQGKLKTGDSVDLAFLARFSLAPEHTWGTDTKTWLDFDHYTPDALSQMLDHPKYKVVTSSWIEKRDDIEAGVRSLPVALQTEAAGRLAGLRPTIPNISALQRHRSDALLETEHYSLGLDSETGAIIRLRDEKTKREWASPDHPLALFSYQTLSKQDYDRFLASYLTLQTDWAPKDFGKPNIQKFGATSHTWTTKLINCSSGEEEDAMRLVARLQIDPAGETGRGVTAWPSEMYLEIVLPKAEPIIQCNFSWFGKRANRMPEALWLTFNPAAPQSRNWLLSKVEQPVSPFDVVKGGNRHMHAISDELSYRDEHGSFSIETLDAPLIAIGERSPIYFSNAQPDPARGIHFSLFNNGWGTNYIQWFGEDMRFRFVIKA